MPYTKVAVCKQIQVNGAWRRRPAHINLKPHKVENDVVSMLGKMEMHL